MANASVLQVVNRATVAQALQQARQQAAEHQSWLNAINRASLFLAAEQWQFDGETLIVTSATTNGTRYIVTPQTCQCKAFIAGRPCWHRAAARLLCKAAEVAQDAPKPKTLAEAQAAVDELFN